jgi:serine/threonine protein kinase
MGVVYAVLDTAIGDKRALKVIRPEFASSEETRLRFVREVRLAQRVAHPNVCRIFDIGFDPPPGVPVEEESDRLIFYTMELLEGQTLAHRIAKRRLDTEMAIGIIRQVAAALKAAHDHDVIHRDLKPANIMLVPERDGAIRAVVMDFGLARRQQEKMGSQLTRTGLIVGTPAYMAPEQLLGESSTASDVYALGIVLYEMTTGTLPFKAAPNAAERTPVPPSRYVPGFDSQCEAVILKCISTDSANRYQDPSEVIAALMPDNQADRLLAAPVTDPNNVATARLEQPVRTAKKRWRIPLSRRQSLSVAAVTVAAVVSLPFVVTRYARHSGSGERYVAVLPFRVVSESPNAELLAIGLVDSISARLFEWQNVRMPSTASVERVGNMSLARVSRELGANVIVHGTIQADGSQVHVNLSVEDVQANRVLARQVV